MGQADFVSKALDWKIYSNAGTKQRYHGKRLEAEQTLKKYAEAQARCVIQLDKLRKATMELGARSESGQSATEHSGPSRSATGQLTTADPDTGSNTSQEENRNTLAGQGVQEATNDMSRLADQAHTQLRDQIRELERDNEEAQESNRRLMLENDMLTERLKHLEENAAGGAATESQEQVPNEGGDLQEHTTGGAAMEVVHQAQIPKRDLGKRHYRRCRNGS